MKYSYSRIATYRQCPAKFKYAYIDKPEVAELPPSPAMERGTKIHDSIEAYMNRSNEFMHPDIHANYGQFMHSIREEHKDVRPEFKWGITWEYEPVDYDHPAVMLRGFVDLLVLPEEGDELIIYEWKTGNKYPEHTGQSFMYAVAMLSHFPQYEKAQTYITYLDKQDFVSTMYPRSMMFEYKPALRREIAQIADETRWPTKPSFKCQWCKYSSRNNSGPCRAG